MKRIFLALIVLVAGCATTPEEQATDVVVAVAEGVAPVVAAGLESLGDALMEFQLTAADIKRMAESAPKGKRVVSIALESGERASCSSADCKFPFKVDSKTDKGSVSLDTTVTLSKGQLASLQQAVQKAKRENRPVSSEPPLEGFLCTAEVCRPQKDQKK
jgi:hypothetical protein